MIEDIKFEWIVFYSSSVVYDFGRHYGYGRSPYAVVDPYHVPVVPLRVAPVAYGLGVQVSISQIPLNWQPFKKATKD